MRPFRAACLILALPLAPARAQRRHGLMMIDGEVDERGADCREEGMAFFLEAGRGADNLALIMLEQMRRSGELAAVGFDEIIEAEITRAKNGDPVAAHRLVHRYEIGDGVEKSAGEMIRYQKIVADAENYPAAKDAAVRLRKLYGRGEGVRPSKSEAENRLRRAAVAGHAGAAHIIASLQNERHDSRTR